MEQPEWPSVWMAEWPLLPQLSSVSVSTGPLPLFSIIKVLKHVLWPHLFLSFIITELTLCSPLSGRALRSQLRRWCWSAWRLSPLMAPSSLCPSWPSGWRGPGRAFSSCCACVCTTVSSPWWTSTTAPWWPTSPCPTQIARASTSTAPCSALWALSPFFCPIISGTRRISTPSVSSALLWQLFPSWAFC